MKRFLADAHIIGGFATALVLSGCSDASNASQDFIQNSGPYKHKASSSVSRASEIVGNFPTGQDREDYARGLEHIDHLHRKIGNYTIYQVIAEGRAVREQHSAAQEAETQRVATAQAAKDRAVADAKSAEEQRHADAQAAEDAHLQHGEPDCLVLDDRSLHTSSGDYGWYIHGTVKNRCDHDFSYAQVEVNFYHDGSVTGSTLANVNNLEAGTSWQWKALGEGENGTWRVQKINGF